MTKLPHVDNFAGRVQRGIGEQVDISMYTKDEGILQSGDEFVDEAVLDALVGLGISEEHPADERIIRLCNLSARVAVGRVLTSRGFEVTYGSFREPTRVVQVHLPVAPPQFLEAQVEDFIPSERGEV
jgi:hypothetical protein